MSTFFIFALAFGILAAAFVLVPLLRAHFAHREADTRPALTVGMGAALAAAIPVAAALLYGQWTTWRWDAPAANAAAASIDENHSMDDAIGEIRLITVWPFPEDFIRTLATRVRGFVVPEINYGQMVLEVERCAAGEASAHRLPPLSRTCPGYRRHRPGIAVFHDC